ncbi:MAG: linear amide C-N hydrolase [Bacteroidales bacterium]|nr:linear amide C-N hydrolase [Bacteroidales bacterium]
MKKFLKVILWFLLGILVLLMLSGLFAWSKFGPLVKGAASVQKLDEGLYYMEYKGDDGFAELIGSRGGRSAADLVGYVMNFLSKGYYNPPAPTPVNAVYGCSALTVRTPENGVLMGRNFDFSSATGIILHTIPQRGYETITTFNSDFFGFGDGWLPEGFANQYMALSGLFFALDGINEKGLAIADLMAGDDAETHQETGKPALTTTSAICYLLKNAATVDKAVTLLRGIDMHSDIGAAHHYAMADATGKSVVVEFVDNEMVVVDSPAVANHYLCEAKFNVGLEESDHRYEHLCQQFEESGGTMDMEQLTASIESVSQPAHDGFLGTAWTAVMDLTNPSITYYSRRHFDKPFHFAINRK